VTPSLSIITFYNLVPVAAACLTDTLVKVTDLAPVLGRATINPLPSSMGAAAMDKDNMVNRLRSRVTVNRLRRGVTVNRRRSKAMGSTHRSSSNITSNISSTTSSNKATATILPSISSSTSGPQAPRRRVMMRTATPSPTGRDTEAPAHRALPRPRHRAPRSSATERRKATLSSTPTARVAAAPC